MTFAEDLQTNIEHITDSDVYCCLYNDSMVDFKNDPWPSIQLAIAILADKPIVVACMPGREPPAKLRMIADEIIYGEPKELAAKLSAYIDTQKGADEEI